MKFWAQRRILDGKLMPDTGRGNRTSTGFDHYGPPRLFPTRGGAARSLAMWCQGIWTTEWDDDGRGLPYLSDKRWHQGNERNPDDYDVVEVQITVIGEHTHG